MSTAASVNGLTIAQMAKSLGVSSRTVRRFIKAGKLQAELVPGPFGEEYRITEIPTELRKTEPLDNTSGQTPVQTPAQTSGQTLSQVMDMVKDLQEKNMALAAQFGAATERIKYLENQVKLLNAARQPWWKRLFRMTA